MENRVISLFSGAGGLDLGFERAGFEIAVAVEQDAACCKTLRKNRPQGSVLEGDITRISTEEILAQAGLTATRPALVIGGPPCQPFSLAGKRKGLNDERGGLVLEFTRVVREALPVGFVMENVKGMLSWGGGAVLKAISDEFQSPILFNGEEYRYELKVTVLNASHFGVPQNRERLFIVGNRKGISFEFPTSSHGVGLKGFSTVGEALAGLPLASEPSDRAKRVSATISERIKKHGY